jgi:hypothetical protein
MSWFVFQWHAMTSLVVKDSITQTFRFEEAKITALCFGAHEGLVSSWE